MATIHLGSISTNKDSLFKVSAVSSTGKSLEYRLVKGKLPQGLSVDPSGEIHGRTNPMIFDLDEGVTTVDAGTTTIDRKFYFTVEAKNKNGVVKDQQEFSITETQTTKGEIANLYAKLRPTKATRVSIDDFIADPDLFPDESIYRKGALNFRTDDLAVLILPGITSPDLTTIYSYMNENFYNATLQLGEIKSAKAKDPKGNTIYEIVYAELIDPYAKSPNEIIFRTQNLNNISFTYYSSSTKILASSPIRASGTIEQVYINSINNMREDLQNGLTVQSYEYLPHWMKSPQGDNIAPGFRLVLPLKYVKPGEADKILFKIKNETTFDLKKVPVVIDRFYVTKHNGTTIDENRISQTATGDGSTKDFVLTQRVTTSKSVLVTIDGVGLDASQYSITETPTSELYIDIRADRTSYTADGTVYTADLKWNATNTVLTFNNAPADGKNIVFKRKKTTFGMKEFVSFDSATTTFDNKGTRFNNQTLTFDNKQPEETQLLLVRSDIMDNIIHTSKQRELIRTPI